MNVRQWDAHDRQTTSIHWSSDGLELCVSDDAHDPFNQYIRFDLKADDSDDCGD